MEIVIPGMGGKDRIKCMTSIDKFKTCNF